MPSSSVVQWCVLAAALAVCVVTDVLHRRILDVDGDFLGLGGTGFLVGDIEFEVSADDVFQARGLVGEDRRQQVVALHALQLRRHLASAGKARQGQRVDDANT